MSLHWLAIVAMAWAAPPTVAGPNAELKAPVIIKAGAEPINVEIGHAAPFVGDINSDGSTCLLVGQFGSGKLRVFKNVGTKTEPRFEKFDWFMAGGKVATVPTG
jgi:hypothetical protein